MKSDSNDKELKTADDLVMDALLREHARLENRSDKELVDSILGQTVNAPVAVANPPQVVASNPARLGIGEWVKLVAVVAVTAFVGVLLLNSFKTPVQVAEVKGRRQDVFHVVVVQSSVSADSNQLPLRRRVELSQLDSNTLKPLNENGDTYELEIVELAVTGVNAPTMQSDFAASVDVNAFTKVTKPSFTVVSNTIEKHGDKVIYSGDVVLKHKMFTLEADSIVMAANNEQRSAISAINAKITHSRVTYECVTDSVTFDPASGEMVARGVSKLVHTGVEKMVVKESVVVFKDANVDVVKELAQPE